MEWAWKAGRQCRDSRGVYGEEHSYFETEHTGWHGAWRPEHITARHVAATWTHFWLILLFSISAPHTIGETVSALWVPPVAAGGSLTFQKHIRPGSPPKLAEEYLPPSSLDDSFLNGKTLCISSGPYTIAEFITGLSKCIQSCFCIKQYINKFKFVCIAALLISSPGIMANSSFFNYAIEIGFGY